MKKFRQKRKKIRKNEPFFDQSEHSTPHDEQYEYKNTLQTIPNVTE